MGACTLFNYELRITNYELVIIWSPLLKASIVPVFILATVWAARTLSNLTWVKVNTAVKGIEDLSSVKRNLALVVSSVRSGLILTII